MLLIQILRQAENLFHLPTRPLDVVLAKAVGDIGCDILPVQMLHVAAEGAENLRLIDVEIHHPRIRTAKNADVP